MGNRPVNLYQKGDRVLFDAMVLSDNGNDQVLIRVNPDVQAWVPRASLFSSSEPEPKPVTKPALYVTFILYRDDQNHRTTAGRDILEARAPRNEIDVFNIEVRLLKKFGGERVIMSWWQELVDGPAFRDNPAEPMGAGEVIDDPIGILGGLLGGKT